MLDAVTLDQLRTFVTVAETGSFSAAARRLQRVQSAVSQAMANLERQLELRLWDRSTRVPTLTPQGRALLVAAQRVSAEVSSLRQLAAALHAGLEPLVSLCIDALFPLSALIDLCREFALKFPNVDLRVDTQTMSAVSARVLGGTATLGVVSPMGLSPQLERRVLSQILLLPVAAPQHPLAQHRGAIPHRAFEPHVQVVLSERIDAGVPDQGVLSGRTWRVSDLHTKHRLLLSGLGWGNLPEHLIHDDLHKRRLVRLRPAGWADDEHALYLSAIYRPDTTFGPAHTWVLQQLESLCQRDAGRPPKKH
jgi:DNA-binding transcriptional LysR family regulator